MCRSAMSMPWFAELAAIDLRVEGSHFWRGAVACTGTEFCKLAITETKGFARWLVEEMETRLPEFDQQLKLHVTGCPNSCGQHWIADVGIEGKKIKHNGALVDAYYFLRRRKRRGTCGDCQAGGLSLRRDAGAGVARTPAARISRRQGAQRKFAGISQQA